MGYPAATGWRDTHATTLHSRPSRVSTIPVGTVAFLIAGRKKRPGLGLRRGGQYFVAVALPIFPICALRLGDRTFPIGVSRGYCAASRRARGSDTAAPRIRLWGSSQPQPFVFRLYRWTRGIWTVFGAARNHSV